MVDERVASCIKIHILYCLFVSLPHVLLHFYVCFSITIAVDMYFTCISCFVLNRRISLTAYLLLNFVQDLGANDKVYCVEKTVMLLCTTASCFISYQQFICHLLCQHKNKYILTSYDTIQYDVQNNRQYLVFNLLGLQCLAHPNWFKSVKSL